MRMAGLKSQSHPIKISTGLFGRSLSCAYLKNDMKPDSCHKCAYPTFRRGRLILDSLLGEILIIDNDWFGDIAVSQMDDWWSTKQRC
jgi:hypothetical protein